MTHNVHPIYNNIGDSLFDPLHIKHFTFNGLWFENIYHPWYSNSCRFLIDLRCHWRNDWKV